MKFLIRVDMEGLTGVTTYDEVWPGKPQYEAHRDVLMHDLLAVCEGLGPHEIVLYDEHHEGRNVRCDKLPPNVRAIVGKPRYTAEDPGGLAAGVDAMIMLGFHAMAGTPGGTLPHSYEHDIAAIDINGRRVGEIGVESALAGELGIPMVLYTGDSAGAAEAAALLPGVRCVAVKQSLGETAAECLGQAASGERLRDAAREVAADRSAWPAPLAVDSPVELRITLHDGRYLRRLRALYAGIVSENRAILHFNSLREGWARYWFLKEAVQRSLVG